MSPCPVCRYHSGPLTRGQQACPYIHLYRPRPESRTQPEPEEEASK